MDSFVLSRFEFVGLLVLDEREGSFSHDLEI